VACRWGGFEEGRHLLARHRAEGDIQAAQKSPRLIALDITAIFAAGLEWFPAG